jgi:hypothetical protein
VTAKSKTWTDLVVGKLGVGEHTDPKTDGLIMLVRPGARGLRRSWLYRAVIGGKRQKIGLGSYPAIGLAHAREEARKGCLHGRQGAETPPGPARRAP